MKTDLYTKIVLTVIAMALVVIVFQNAGVTPVTTAQAAVIPAPAPQAVQREVIDVNIVQYGGIELNPKNKEYLDFKYVKKIPVSNY